MTLTLEHALIPAVPVPLAVGGQIDREAQERYVQWMAAQPVGGIAVWAHTGRGLLLTRGQRQEVMRSWREGMPGSIPIIAGAGGKSADEAVAMAEDAAAWGADLIMAYAPAFLRGRPDQDEQIVEHHRRLAQVGKPLLLFYLYEAAGGISYSRQVLAELFRLPGVAGIKMATLDSVMTYQDVSGQIHRDHPGVLLISGEDRFLGYSLMAGARSALVGMGAACTAMQARLLSAYYAGDWDRFHRLNRLVDAFAQITFIRPMEGYIQRMLWALALESVIPAEATYDPWGPPVGRDEVSAIAQFLNSVNGEEW